MWKDIAKWVAEEVEGAGDEAARGLALFHAEPDRIAGPLRCSEPLAEWAFVPISDLLLVVGEGRVGITAEGIFADNPPGHKRLSLADCYKKKAAT